MCRQEKRRVSAATFKITHNHFGYKSTSPLLSYLNDMLLGSFRLTADAESLVSEQTFEMLKHSCLQDWELADHAGQGQNIDITQDRRTEGR